MRNEWTWRHKSPPPTLQIFFQDTQVAELRKQPTDQGQVYTFRYLPAFKLMNLAPLPGFPSLEKIYTSPELWQYFRERIPDIGRPEIAALLKARKISKHDDLRLLAELGARSVTDPFEIRCAA